MNRTILLTYLGIIIGALVVATTFAFITSGQINSSRTEFIQECENAGGKYVYIRHRQYCIIDGVRFSRDDL